MTETPATQEALDNLRKEIERFQTDTLEAFCKQLVEQYRARIDDATATMFTTAHKLSEETDALLGKADGGHKMQLLNDLIRVVDLIINNKARTAEDVKDELEEILLREGAVKHPVPAGEAFDESLHQEDGSEDAPRKKDWGTVADASAFWDYEGKVIRKAPVTVYRDPKGRDR